jgi:hypothetical protein
MENKDNPYQTPERGPLSSTPNRAQNAGEPTDSLSSSVSPFTKRLVRVFTYSYMPSLIVAIAVVPAWILLLIRATPAQLRRTRGPDIVELIFIFATTLPSVLTCLAFSWCYCTLCRKKERPTIWPAIVFGILSGLVFNGITSITVIEYFFNW